MKLLLTSAGIKNTSIRDALVGLLGKPIAQSNALCIPTAIYAFPGGAGSAWKLISGRAAAPCANSVGSRWESWNSPHCPPSKGRIWTTRSRRLTPFWWEVAIPCICATGSNSQDWLTSCRRCAIVWVGVSAGSLVMGPQVGEGFVSGSPPTTGDDERWVSSISRCSRT